jgi:integrase
LGATVAPAESGKWAVLIGSHHYGRKRRSRKWIGVKNRCNPVSKGLLRFHDLRHTVMTELAEMGLADHVLESISGRLSRRMLDQYSHIRIDAKRQALDALDAARRGAAANGNDNQDDGNDAEIEALVEVPDDLTS